MNEKELIDSFSVLIVEDDSASRTLLEKILTKAGYEFVSVENGRKALDLFNEKFFQIVLTDWVMPEMNGIELCKAIRSRVYPGYVFIILLTAKSSKANIITGLEAGADDYLTKPFNNTELVARLNTGKRVLKLERDLKSAHEKIRVLSITDPLTGSYNRGHLSQRLPHEINRAMRYGRALSLIMCDIDHFKEVNDTYGHLIGDEVLRQFVEQIKKSIRCDLDWLVRYGGEEFLIVLPETDLEGASRTAKRLHCDLSQRVIESHGQHIRITASFGVTCFDPKTSPAEQISAEALINKADHYLYLAKQEGRNRVKGGQL